MHGPSPAAGSTVPSSSHRPCSSPSRSARMNRTDPGPSVPSAARTSRTRLVLLNGPILPPRSTIQPSPSGSTRWTIPCHSG